MVRHLLVLLALLMAGCASREPLAPKQGEALIVFIVPGMMSDGGRYQPTYGIELSLSIHAVTATDRTLVGILSIGQKLAHPVSPGRHQFMLVSPQSTDFLEANVAAGKTYYTVVLSEAPTPGLARHSFRPVRQRELESRAFSGWESSASFVKRSDRWEAWAKRNAAMLDGRLKRGWPDWANRSPDQRSRKTLHVADGR